MMQDRKNVAIMGLGLLGTSLGLALKGNCLRIGWARRKESLEYAVKIDACDIVSDNVAEVLSKADLSVICLPVKTIVSFAKEYCSYFKEDSIVTDIGSVKSFIVNELFELLKKRNVEFIGSHPMAGSEQSGAEFAREDIYQNATVFVTPLKANTQRAIENLSELWTFTGAKVKIISPEEHDRIVAYSSHLVHLAAAALNLAVLNAPEDEMRKRAQACAGGFKDSTRVAASSPEMWREIIECNSLNILSSLNELEKYIREIRNALQNKEFEQIYSILVKSAELRKKWPEKFNP